jgi:hypothetical protein
MADEVAPYAPDSDEDGSHEAVWTDAVEWSSPAKSSSWWSRLLALILGGGGPSNERLARLDQAIERQPNVAANYVLRGELYLQADEPVLAARDFKTAFEIETDRFERENWGVLSQVMRDRAERGLELARRRRKKH